MGTANFIVAVVAVLHTVASLHGANVTTSVAATHRVVGATPVRAERSCAIVVIPPGVFLLLQGGRLLGLHGL